MTSVRRPEMGGEKFNGRRDRLICALKQQPRRMGLLATIILASMFVACAWSVDWDLEGMSRAWAHVETYLGL